MAPLNPYFLQGSASEQRLVQDLINEHLKIYGQDIVYMPRKFISEKTIITEAIVSKFDDSFRLEAYINNFEGFGGQGDILSKFGVRSTDEITFIISKERYEDFVSPFLVEDNNIKVATRPQEGDLIYLPVDNSLFEVKYVEGKRPFYQLNNLYVYELRCELYEYEDDVIDTGIDAVDKSVQDFGYIQTLIMVGSGATQSTASLDLSSAQVQYTPPSYYSVGSIDLINDGYGYLSTPTIEFSPPPTGGIKASAVAIMTSRTGYSGQSIDKILVVNPGIGYTEPPTVNIKSNSGAGGIATAVIAQGTVGPVSIVSGGVGYSTVPNVSISTSPSGQNASAQAFLNSAGQVSAIRFTNAGAGYTQAPTITIEPPIVGFGTGDYKFNEVVTGSKTGTTARVKDWDATTKTLKLSIIDGNFALGENIVGMGITANGSSANYKVFSVDTYDQYDDYAENIPIQNEANEILDFSQKNPFGTY
jgi:hypothetical protein